VRALAAVTGWAGIWRFSQHPALPHASCGQVTIGPASTGPAAPLICFSSAAQEWKTASLGVTWPSVDTGSKTVFTVEPGGRPCRVSEVGQNDAPGTTDWQMGTVSCREKMVLIALEMRASLVRGRAER